MRNRRGATGRMLAMLALSIGAGTPTATGAEEPRPKTLRIELPDRNFHVVTFSPDGTRLLIVGETGDPEVRDSSTGRTLLKLEGHKAPVLRAVYAPNGKRIATSAVETQVKSHRPRGPEYDLRGGVMKVWDAATGREIASTTGDDAAVQSLSFSDDGRFLATLDGSNVARLRDSADLHKIVTIPGNFEEGNRSVSVSRYIATDAARHVACSTCDVGREDRGPHPAKLKLWDLGRNRYRNVDMEGLGFGSAGRNCIVTPDGRYVVTSYYDLSGSAAVGLQKVAVIDFDTGAVVRRTETEMEIYEDVVKFSPDGKLFLSALAGGGLRVWDFAKGHVIRTIQGPEGLDIEGRGMKTLPTRDVAFLPRSIRVASGGVRTWNDRGPKGEVLAIRKEPLLIWEAELPLP